MKRGYNGPDKLYNNKQHALIGHSVDPGLSYINLHSAGIPQELTIVIPASSVVNKCGEI